MDCCIDAGVKADMSTLAIRLRTDEEGNFVSEPFPAEGSWSFTGVAELAGSWWAMFEEDSTSETEGAGEGTRTDLRTG